MYNKIQKIIDYIHYILINIVNYLYYKTYIIGKISFKIYSGYDTNNDNNINENILQILEKKFFKLYNENKKFTYINYTGIKYRIVIKLYDNSRMISIKNNLVNIPIEKNINSFGNNYIRCVRDVKYLTNLYRYFYKTDIHQAYSSVNINILLQILKRNSIYINNDDYIYIKKILCGYYNISNTYVQLNMLPQGLNISNILFSLYMNEIFKEYNNRTGNDNIYIYVDDILIFSKHKESLNKNVTVLHEILKSYNFNINYNKSKNIDIRKNSLIFLKRIIVSNYDTEERTLIKNYLNSHKIYGIEPKKIITDKLYFDNNKEKLKIYTEPMIY